MAKKLKDAEPAPENGAPPAERMSKPWPAGKAKRPRWASKMEKELAKLRAVIKSANLAHRSADIESLVRPAIRLKLRTVKSAAINGVVTRFGGDPDVPPGFRWPSAGKTPMAFVAQYRLDELAKFDLEAKLPRRGVLAVFGNLVPFEGYGEAAKAFHFPSTKGLVRTAPPHGADADQRPSKVATATASVKLTLPSPDSRTAATLRLGQEERDRYHDQVWLATMATRDDPTEPGTHQLLGWPDQMNEHAYAGWELLAQVDSDDRFGLEIGDVETLRFHVTVAKLAAGNFGAVRSAIGGE